METAFILHQNQNHGWECGFLKDKRWGHRWPGCERIENHNRGKSIKELTLSPVPFPKRNDLGPSLNSNSSCSAKTSFCKDSKSCVCNNLKLPRYT